MKRIQIHPIILFLSFQLLFYIQVFADTNSLVLQLPVDCQPGQTCFIQNFVDVDPTPAYKDYTCGFLSYDNHKGTDFRLPNLSAMEKGVKVLAAAPGIVRATRDGMPDININKIDPSLIEDREAGNSVAVRHGNGWETQYSHLLKGSVAVKSGQKINSGDVLGFVGLSGNTEFPHLHFSVRHHGKIIDPFSGLPGGTGCRHNKTMPLWDADTNTLLAYQASGLLEAGFTDHVPQARPLHEYIENKASLPVSAKRIIFWSHVFGVRKNDIQQLEIISPDGKILAIKQEKIEKNQARLLKLIGIKLVENTWPDGIYKGIYTLKRHDGEKLETAIYKTIKLEIIESTP